MRYFSNVCLDRGPIVYDTVTGAIGVLEALDQPLPLGLAMCIGRDAAGCALWGLVVHDEVVPGRWMVVDRQFHPAE